MVWGPTLELADAVVIVVRRADKANESPGVGVVRTLARNRRVPQIVVDAQSDLEETASQLRAREQPGHDLDIMVFGPRATRWATGEHFGWQLVTSLALAKAKPRHRVLVVDNHPESAQAICQLIGLLGYESFMSTSGREALQKFEAFRPSIALVDVNLPDLSGYELARELRRIHGDALFLAAISDANSAREAQHAHALGFDQQAFKPLDIDRIRVLLDAATERLSAELAIR